MQLLLSQAEKAQAVKDADEVARREFHSALCDGADYAKAIARGAAVYKAAMTPLLEQAGLA